MAANKWWTLGAVCTATFMLLLDITVVNVALPDIQRSLDASFTDLQWVVDAYALGLASFMLSAGSLADLVGRRRIFVSGLVVFSVASLLCGLSGTPTVLNLARVLQGIGGAAMFSTSLALIAQEFHGRDRGTAFGLWGATVGAAVAIGPVVGGVLTDTLGWESIFFVNLPIGAAAIFVAITRVGEARDPEGARIDWPGLVTFSAALFLLVFALVRGNDEGWESTLIVGFLIGAAVLLVASSPSRAPARSRCSTSRSSASPRSPEPRSSPSRCRRRCSRCSSTSRSTSRTRSATSRSTRACASFP